MLSLIVIGQIVASLPIGWLADHMDRRVLLIVNGAVSLLCCLLLPAVLGNTALLFITLFLLGSATAGMYTLGLVRLGEIFAPHELGSATAVFILVTQIGGVAGPIIGGAGMDAWDPHGFIVVTALANGLFCVFAVWRYMAMRRH
jgi:MFS family permease